MGLEIYYLTTNFITAGKTGKLKRKIMKKIFTLLLSSLFSLSLFAFDGSRLNISTVGDMELRVEVDGQRFTMQDNTVTLRDLGEGYHQVKIFKEKRKGRGHGWGNGRRGEVIYNNSVYLRRGYELDIIVSRYGKVFTDENRIERFDRDDRNDDDDNWNNGYGNVMSNREFEIVKEQIRKEWFENNRLVSAKTIVDKSNFTAQQIKELVQLFTFDNNKLELAKYAYRKTVDKHNYYLVSDMLTFNSSKDELARFIRESR
jgi:hypothetical protein